MAWEDDVQLISQICLDITELFRTIVKIVPKDKEFLLKNLSAASIHMAFFTKDIANSLPGELIDIEKVEKIFLENCGCQSKEFKNASQEREV
jgi:hypothetical protein